MRCFAFEFGDQCPHEASVLVAGQEYCAYHAERLAEAFAERAKVVYFVARDGLIKIGTSNDVTRRLASIGGGRIVATETGGYKRERELHDRFVDLRVRGEWFRPEGALLEYLRTAHRIPSDAVAA